MKIFKKEKDVTDLAVSYLDACQECVESAEKTVRNFIEGETSDIRERSEQVSNFEGKADKLRRKMRDKLFSGAYLPLMRGDIFGLVESMDGIPNAAEACCRLLYSERPEIPDSFRSQFQEVAEESFKVFHPLKKSLKGFFKPKDKVDSIRHNAEAISKQEAVVDGVELKLTIAIFEDTSIDLAQKNHLRRLLGHIVEISDRAEDVADTLLLIAMKAVG